MGGYNEIVAESGPRRVAKLKFESGVHRVHRVPDTETRVAASTSVGGNLPGWSCVRRVDVRIKSERFA